jgi:hypothetical protein
MTLAELAFGCYIYAALIGEDDGGYSQLLAQTNQQLDLSEDQHCKSLLVWLNKWGCRQFKKSQHELAATEIKAWYSEFGPKLFPRPKSLLLLTEHDLSTIDAAYGDLVNRIASVRTMGGGAESKVRVGPVGTAKILFAVRPNALMLWDNPILEALGLDGSAASYVSYLRKATKWLNELADECQRHGIEIAALPSLLGRPRSYLPKLIDEYLWVTVSQNCRPPSKSVFERWAAWA